MRERIGPAENFFGDDDDDAELSPVEFDSSEIPDREAIMEQKRKAIDHLFRFLQKIGASEALKSDESKREFIAGLNFETAKKLLVAFNGIINQVPITERAVNGGTGATMGFTTPPRHEDKGPLLEDAFSAIKRMSESGNSFDDIAILAGVVINAIHPFEDGNGRTSRLSYFLLADPHPDFDSERETVDDLLEETRGRRMVDFDSYYTQGYANAYVSRRMGLDPTSDMTPQYLSGEDAQLSEALIQNGNIGDTDDYYIRRMNGIREGTLMSLGSGLLAFAKYLKDAGRLEEYSKHELLERSSGNGEHYLSSVNAVGVVRDLDAKGAQKLVADYWEVKKEAVEVLIDSIEHPDNYPTHPERKDEEDYEPYTLLDSIKRSRVSGILLERKNPRDEEEFLEEPDEDFEPGETDW